jgi:hypothetical protein
LEKIKIRFGVTGACAAAIVVVEVVVVVTVVCVTVFGERAQAYTPTTTPVTAIKRKTNLGKVGIEVMVKQ